MFSRLALENHVYQWYSSQEKMVFMWGWPDYWDSGETTLLGVASCYDYTTKWGTVTVFLDVVNRAVEALYGHHMWAACPPTCQQETVVDIHQWKGKGLTSRLVWQLYSSAWITLCRSVVQWVAVSFSAAYAHHVSRPTQQNTNYYHNQEI